jgi:GNAT superfamily N-acetyltransferase
MTKLVRKLLGHVFAMPRLNWLWVITRELDDSLPDYQARISFDPAVLPPDAEEIEVSLAHIPEEHRPDVEQRTCNGHRCFVARHNGQIIYACWVAFGTCYSYALSREYELAGDEAYGYGAYALPEWRGNGVHPAMICWVARTVMDWGYTQMFCFLDWRSLAAMRMPKKLGGRQSGVRKVGATGFIEAFGFRWYFHWDHGAFKALKRRFYRW